MKRIAKFLGAGSDLHRQIYMGVRQYPDGFLFTGLVGFNVGAVTIAVMFLLMG